MVLSGQRQKVRRFDRQKDARREAAHLELVEDGAMSDGVDVMEEDDLNSDTVLDSAETTAAVEGQKTSGVGAELYGCSIFNLPVN